MPIYNTYKNKLGIILPTLHDCQLSYQAISSANDYLINGRADVVIFFEELSNRVLIPNCATMNLGEIGSFDGVLISTTLKNTLASIRAVNAARKIFYIFSLEWLRDRRNFMENTAIYRHQDIELITHNEYYAEVIENYCNRRPSICEFNIAKLIEKYLGESNE